MYQKRDLIKPKQINHMCVTLTSKACLESPRMRPEPTTLRRNRGYISPSCADSSGGLFGPTASWILWIGVVWPRRRSFRIVRAGADGWRSCRGAL